MSYIYTFIREDLSPEQKIIQIGHACHESGKRTQDEEISSLVLLSVENEQDLKNISEELDMKGIEHYMFYEPDFGPMGYTALCTRPITEKREQRLFRKWKLYRSQ